MKYMTHGRGSKITERGPSVIRRTLAFLPAIAILAATGDLARANFSLTPTAGNVNTILTTGVRGGNNNVNYLDVEGTPGFQSFGVLDFSTAGHGLSSGQTIGSLTLDLTQSNAGFSSNGPVNFYVSESPGVAVSSLTYQTANAPEGVGAQLGTLLLLGSATFTQQSANFQHDLFTFTPGASLASYLVGQVNAGQDVRLVITAENSTVAATWAGLNPSFPTERPTLSFITSSAVPEPSSLVLVGVGIAGVAALRRRTSRAA